MGDKLLSNLEVEYKEAQKELQAQLDGWYQKYADENGLSIAQAKKKLNPKETKAHKNTIEEYIAKAETGDHKFENELRRRYMQSRVSRLEALQNQVSVQLALLAKHQDGQTMKLLEKIAEDTFYRTLRQAGQIGLIGRFDRFNPDLLKQICRSPWSGHSFSEIIWKNNKQLIKEVRHILSQGAIGGMNIQRMSSQLSKRMHVSYSRAENLVRTESNYVLNQATKMSYQKTKMGGYQYLATLDSRTSEICQSLDNQIFQSAESKVGVNYPPMHPRCRSTTIPYFDDEFTQGTTRFARDENGKGIEVDAKMSYPKWRKIYGSSNQASREKETKTKEWSAWNQEETVII